MKKKVTTAYFPKGLKFFAPPVFLAGLYLLYQGYPGWGITLAVLAVIVLTTNYVTEIDLVNKRYSDHLSLAGIALNKEESMFNAIDHIVITKGNHSQRVVSRIQSRQMDWSDFTATLLFDDGRSLDILTRGEKRQLIMEIKALAEFLNAGVEDQTTRDHYFIDLSQVGQD